MGTLYQLTKAELDVVIDAAQASPDDNSPAMNEVLRRFTPLARRVARSQSDCHHFREDLFIECLRVAVGATRRHRIGSPGFPSYMESFMKGAASRLAQSERTYLAGPCNLRIHSLDNPDVTSREFDDAVPIDAVVGERMSGPWGDGVTAQFIDALNDKQKRLLERTYVDGVKVKELAAELSITSSAVSQQIATIHRKARREFAA